MQAGTYFPKVRRMLLCFSPLIWKHFWPASTLLRGHLALSTLSPKTCPHNLERWGYADEVHLGKSVVYWITGLWRSWLVSLQTTGFPVLSYISVCALRGLWLSCLVFPGLSDAVDDRAGGGLSMLRAIKLIIGLDFAVTLSSPDSFCVLFDITSEHSAELKWLMLNKHKRWFHSSRMTFPLVNMSASWFLVSVYLIWILGSKLIRSINQSRATLWVLETCLIVGLLPFIIILISASLSSNTYNKASWCENRTFEGTRSTSSKTLITPRDWFHRSIMVLSCVSKD